MRPLRLIPSDTRIDFVGKHRLAFGLSGVLIVASILLTLVMGLNFGIDFRGGILMEVRTPQAADISAMRSTLSDLELGEVSLQQFGSDRDVLIRIQRQAGDEEAQIAAIDRVRTTLGDAVEYRRTEFVGPTVGQELIRAGTMAVVLAVGAILIYIWFRFEWQFGLSAVLALVHDVISTIGLFALIQHEFNLATVAALLTIAGYSINDTVVVFDRVRENLRRYKKATLGEVLNRSINETLSRTLMTSVTTLIALVALYALGGAVIRDFAFALIWGILIGTYSSVFIAVPALFYLNPRRSEDKAADGTPETASGGRAD